MGMTTGLDQKEEKKPEKPVKPPLEEKDYLDEETLKLVDRARELNSNEENNSISKQRKYDLSKQIDKIKEIGKKTKEESDELEELRKEVTEANPNTETIQTKTEDIEIMKNDMKLAYSKLKDQMSQAEL